MTVVIDASAATTVCLSADGFGLISDSLSAPVLLRSEVLAAVQGMQWRGEISEQLAELAVGRLLEGPIRLVRRIEVYREARRIAGALGWAKTYDAEYVALARLSGFPLLTVDDRLARRVRDLVDIRLPGDL